jgi:hypothetical protein
VDALSMAPETGLCSSCSDAAWMRELVGSSSSSTTSSPAARVVQLVFLQSGLLPHNSGSSCLGNSGWYSHPLGPGTLSVDGKIQALGAGGAHRRWPGPCNAHHPPPMSSGWCTGCSRLQQQQQRAAATAACRITGWACAALGGPADWLAAVAGPHLCLPLLPCPMWQVCGGSHRCWPRPSPVCAAEPCKAAADACSCGHHHTL